MSESAKLNDVFTAMTLRDIFAAHAMQSLLQRGWVDNDGTHAPIHYAEGVCDERGDPGCPTLSKDAYRIADAMLAERMEGPKP